MEIEDMEMEYAGLLNSIDNGIYNVDSAPPTRAQGTMKWKAATSPQAAGPECEEEPIGKRFSDDL